jgi:carbon-monoxide dehydrogenase large subunit
MAFIGQSVRRFEDARFLIGQGRYVADLPVEGALHMVVLRSPHAHARICRIDTAAAQAFVLTAGALAEGGIGRLPCPAQIGVPIAMAERPVRKLTLRSALVDGKRVRVFKSSGEEIKAA